MIRSAPRSRAAWIIHKPTCPHPTTRTLEPGSTRPTLTTAPIPETIPQPNIASHSSGRSLSTGNTWMSRMTERSAYVPEWPGARTSVPSSSVPTTGAGTKSPSHWSMRPIVHQ